MDLTTSQKEAWDKLGQRYEKVGFGELSNAEQHFVALEALAGDTLNGSLDQYFFNSSGDLALVAIEALDALGEVEVSTSLRAVILDLWPAGYPTDRSDRYENIAAVQNEGFFDKQSEIIVATHERFLVRSLAVLENSYANG